MLNDDDPEKRPGRPPRLALLIDAENIPPKSLAQMLQEISGLGELVVRYCYGDFERPQLERWTRAAAQHGLEIRHQPAPEQRRNSSDIRMTIEAMDLLHTGDIDAFCLATGDGDFTPLAMRIRQEGLEVFGFGGFRASKSFCLACTRFIYLDNRPRPAPENGPKSSRPSRLPFRAAGPILWEVLKEYPAHRGWIPLEEIETILSRKIPDFDHRSYGCASLFQLFKKLSQFRTHQIPRNGKIWVGLGSQARGKPPGALHEASARAERSGQEPSIGGE